MNRVPETARPRPRVRRRQAGLAALLLAAGALAGCSGSSGGPGGASPDGPDGDALRPVTVVLDWTPNTNHAGMYLAQAEGWYRDVGLDVRFVEPGESGSLALLASDRADIAVSVQEEVVPARVQGLPVRAVAAVIQHNTSSLVSLASDGIESPADLPGATYGGYGGQLETALLDALVACGGGEPGSVDTVDVGEADYRVGLERDQYDLVWIFDAWDGIRLQQEGVETNRIAFADQSDCIPDWYTPVLVTSERVEEERAEDLDAFLAATARGYREAMADPEAAADALLAGADDLDPKLVRASAEYLATRYADDPDAWGRFDPEVWSRFEGFLVDAGMIDAVPEGEPAWTNEHLPEP